MTDRKPLVYVFEDNQVMCALICLHLTQAGYDVQGFEDAVEGGKALFARRPDLLVLDLGMPYLDGLELAKAMHGDAQTQDVPIVVVTARTDMQAENAAWEAGVKRYLTKPLQRQLLLKAVEEVLSEGRAAA